MTFSIMKSVGEFPTFVAWPEENDSILNKRMKLHIEDLSTGILTDFVFLVQLCNDLSYIIKISAQQVAQRFPTGFNNGRFRITKSLY